MRYPAGFIVVCASLIVSSSALSEPRGKSIRKVQLISMTGGARLDTPATAGEPEMSVDTVNPPPLPASFQIHDLSRRYVEFRMQQEMMATAVPSGATSLPTGDRFGVAASSSISVPSWLRRGLGTYQPVSFEPGCAPLAYRPSGFLARSAESRRAAYYGMMSAVACEHGIPTGLFDAMIIRESGYNPIATSSANAFGLAQLMPGTALGMGIDRYDPLQNMRGGARYLRRQLDKFGQVPLALAAYNAGPSRIRGGLIPRIPETQAYVANIIANWSRLTTSAGSLTYRSSGPSVVPRNVILTNFDD